jgi:TP901 family phage tail tape measure protein
MATDKISVDLLLNTRRADRELARLNREFAKLGKTMGGSFGGAGKGGDKVRALGTGLSKATVKADEFTKSLEASNARVVAFGASAGIIMQIDRAFKGMVTSTMKVEKALLDVNVVLNVTNKNLKKFGEGMFQISRQTAQGFDVVAEAATELARQGLGVEQTLTRTKDALILTRLTGMGAADAVKSLTAAVNSFNKEGVTSADIINRMAKVDAAFAVSSDDLAKSISRVGASAVSAGVNMNELMAITTAVQQKTARGGAVIGNAFKTIFTRIQRTDVLQKLRNIGVAVTDMQGNMLSGMQVLQNLAGNFDKLSKSQQSSVSESVAGVFQVNILKAAMSDLSSQTSNYSRALQTANSATDEAYKRNEQLNQSLDALSNRALANLTQAGASIGGGTLEPAIKRVLNIVNTSMESFGKGGLMEGFGQTWGKGIMKGLGKFIAGPGLVLVVATIGKLFYNLTKFTGKAFADIMGINKASQQRVTIEGAIVDTLAKQPALLSSVLSGDTKILTIEQQILATIRKQSLERQAMQVIAAPIAASMMGQGLHVGRSGGMSFKGRGRAGGFVPNFADAGSERAAAAAGGYQAGSVRTMNQPGAGTMMYNSAETVKRFPGMSQSAIMPPQGSSAGAGYKSAFGAAHGFDPYAGAGFVPNFAFNTYSKLGKGKGQQMPTQKEHFQAIGVSKAGKGKEQRQLANDFVDAGGHLTVKKNALAMLIPKLGYENLKHTGKGVGKNKNWTATFPSLGYSQTWATKNKNSPPEDIVDQMVKAAAEVAANVSLRLKPPGTNWKAPTFEKAIRGTLEAGHAGHGIKGAMGSITGAAGSAFETGVLASMRLSADDPENKTAMSPGGLGFKPADWDVFSPNKAVKSLFGGGAINWKKGDLKITDRETPVDSMIGKLLNDLLYGGVRGDQLTYKSNLEAKGGSAMMLQTPVKELAYQRKLSSERPGYGGMLATKRRRYGGGGGAGGYVPNFASALSNAIGREMQAGIPASSIRVGSSPVLKSAGNPGGVGVYNTRQEPGGLQQGISRAKAQGVSPKQHGVPNFSILGPTGLPLPGPAERKAAVAARQLELQLEKVKKGFIKIEKPVAGLGAEATSSTKSLKGMRGGMAGMALAQMGSMAAMGAKEAGLFEEGSTGDKTLGAVSSGLMWGGTAAMIHPVLGIVVGLSVALADFTGIIGGTAEKTRDLNKELEDLSAREGRTAETFSRIAEEMDKINTSAFGPNKYKKLDEQRNALFAFVKEEYGDVTPGFSGIFKDIENVSTGKGVLDVLEQAAGVSRGKGKALRMLKLFEETQGTTGGVRIAERGRAGSFDTGQFIDAQSAALNSLTNITVAGKGWTTGNASAMRKRDVFDLAGKRNANLNEDIKAILNENPSVYAPGSKAGQSFIPLDQSQKDRIAGMDIGSGATRGANFLRLNDQIRKRQNAAVGVETQKGTLDLGDLISGRTGGTSLMQDLSMWGAQAKKIPFMGRDIGTTTFSEPSARLGLELEKETFTTALIEAQKRFFSAPGFGSGDKGASFMAESLADLAGAKGPGRDSLVKGILEQAEKQANVGEGGSAAEVLLDSMNKIINEKLTDAELTAVLEQRLGAEKQLVEKAKEEIKAQIQRVKTFRESIKALDGLSASLIKAQAGLKHQLVMDKQETAHSKKMVGLQQRGVGMRAKATMDPYGVAASARAQSFAIEAERFRGANIDAESAFTAAAGKIQIDALSSAVKDIFKTATEGKVGLAAGVLGKRTEDVQAIFSSISTQMEGVKTLKELSPDDVRKLADTLSELGGLAAGEGGKWAAKLTDQQRFNFEAAMKLLPQIRKLEEEYGNGIKQRKDLNAKNKITIEGQHKLAMEEIKLRFTYNRELELFVRNLANIQAQLKLTFGRKDVKTGKISGSGLVSLEKDALEKRRNDRGLGPMALEQKSAFEQGFRGGMTYNARSYLDELEDGSRQVATTMKTSFADAFKSIASGASSAQEAMAQFAGNILNTISDMSAKMATNMLFAKMGFAEGGLIPRYGGGGVVTGGSGTKDDVLSMMNGGEYVIKKSSAKKIGYDTLNAINSGGVGGFAEGGAQKGGGNMGKMFAVSAAASAASGLVSGQWGKSKKKPWRGQDYGQGRGEYGYFGGPDSDARGADSIAGGGRGAQVSLNKAYVYYRRDPETGKLVSERVRPTEGKYEVSGALSLLGRLNEDDRQTGRMFGKEQKMGAYSDYLFTETENRKDIMKAHKKQKRGRLISAYMNAAMLIGGSYMMDRSAAGVAAQGWETWQGDPNPDMDRRDLFNPSQKSNNTRMAAAGGSMGKTPALLTGGEYVMGADTVRQYGLDFMGELNRGGVPGMAAGGPVSRGNQGAVAGVVSGGETNNNVNISINVDKRGNVEAKAAQDANGADNVTKENTVRDAENNKDLGKALQTVVLQELIRQQRPGGLLQKS